jgi:hypothetical protein
MKNNITCYRSQLFVAWSRIIVSTFYFFYSLFAKVIYIAFNAQIESP